MHKINTYLITGFLGTGKTTVLNTLLKQVAHQKNVIVENEFGKVNIDKQLIDTKYDELYELTNGCICCTYDEGFFDLLTELYPRRNEIHNLFIETTGVADVAPIIAAFQREDVKRTFSLLNTICIVDAESIDQHVQEFTEAEKQIVLSDIIIINKAGHVDATTLQQVVEQILEKNPLAKILQTTDGYVALQQLNTPNATDKLPQLQNVTKTNRHSPLKTHLYETTEAIDINKFRHVMTITMLLYSNQIYRTKGFVKASDGRTYLFQSAGKGTTLTQAENNDVNKTQLVFIGKSVEYKSVERIMNQTIAKSA